VQLNVFTVTYGNNHHKRNSKKPCENPLALSEHFYLFLGKINQFINVNLMKKRINAVKEFHKAFGLGMKEEPTADLGEAKNLLRFHLMKEENEEYLEAANNNDLVEVADALGDMLYILCGTIIEHGMQHKIEEVFAEIQLSNMSKLGVDGKPIYREDGKVLKGPNYFKPNIEDILK
jgi:predicted HAD superfamily Cof-like phosphohydrolase